MSFCRFNGLNITNSGKDWSINTPSSFFRAILNSKLQWIHPQFFAQFVDYGFCHSGVSSTWSSVRRRFWYIENNIVTINEEIVDTVRRENTLRATINKCSWVSSCLIDQFRFGSSDLTILFDSHFNSNI